MDERRPTSSIGIFVTTADNAILNDNRVLGMDVCVAFQNATVKYRDTMTSGCGIAYDGSAIDLGGNN